MTTPVQERLQAEFEHAKTEGKERVERITDILKAAASMTFQEIKEGSSEIHGLTRKSIAEMLDEFQESADVMVGEVLESTEDAPSADTVAPTWRELAQDAVSVLRDRKGDWLHQLKHHWETNLNQFDADMTADHGDRYRQLKTVVQSVIGWVKGTIAQPAPAHEESATKPVVIEVLDDEPVVHQPDEIEA